MRCPASGCSHRLSLTDVERLAEPDVVARFRELYTADVSGKTAELLSDPVHAEWVKSHTTPCPSCHQLIERSMGCSSMHCLCGQKFCFTCGQSNDEETLRTVVDVPERCASCRQRSLFIRDPDALRRFHEDLAARSLARRASHRASEGATDAADAARSDARVRAGIYAARSRARAAAAASTDAETRSADDGTRGARDRAESRAAHATAMHAAMAALEEARAAAAEARSIAHAVSRETRRAASELTGMRSHAREAGASMLAFRHARAEYRAAARDVEHTPSWRHTRRASAGAT